MTKLSKSVNYKALSLLHFDIQSIIEKANDEVDASNKIADKYKITEDKAKLLMDAWMQSGQLEIVGKKLGLLK
jgi:hypothetical protein